MVFGNLGRMLAAAAGEREGSILATVLESGCGGSQPPSVDGVVGGGLIWAKAPYTSVWRVVTGLDTPRRLTTRYSFNGPRPQDSP
jgi:hypothetical protein